MTTLAARIAHRYLNADAFVRLDAIPIVVLADGGIVSSSDLERLLQVHDIDAGEIMLYRQTDDPANTFRWKGRNDAGSLVLGQLVLHLKHDSKHVMVSGEIVLAMTIVGSQVKQQRDPLPIRVKQRLMLISSIARRAIADLRERPQEIDVVVAHLTDIVELAEQSV